jgi:hypothetical protein
VKFSFYKVDIDLIDFLRGEGRYISRPANKIDKEIKKWEGVNYKFGIIYIGVIINIDGFDYLAPLTSDKNNFYLNKDEDSTFFKIFTKTGYKGSLLLSKALPLTKNLFSFESLESIRKTTSEAYAALCNRQLQVINNNVDNIIKKLKECFIYDSKDISLQKRKINYMLALKNIAEYNELLLENKK